MLIAARRAVPPGPGEASSLMYRLSPVTEDLGLSTAGSKHEATTHTNNSSKS